MTTLAYCDGILATDALIVLDGEIKLKRPHKLYVLPEMGAVCLCGDGNHALAVAKWLFNGAKGYKPGGEWEAVYLTKEGTLYEVGYDWPIQMMDNCSYYAYGSGSPYALSAMYLGNSAITAVECSANFDLHTDKPVSYYNADTGAYSNVVLLTLDDLKELELPCPPSTQN